MRKLLLFMHISLDGFAAEPSGEMDWIIVDETIFDLASGRTNEADTALYGRATYEMMDSYWPTAAGQPGLTKHDIEHSAWYNSVDKVVMSRSMKSMELKRTTVIGNEIKRKNGKNILMFGSPGAAHSLMSSLPLL